MRDLRRSDRLMLVRLGLNIILKGSAVVSVERAFLTSEQGSPAGNAAR